MIDQPPRDLVLVKLSELRDEMQAGFASIRAELATLNDTVRSLAKSNVSIQREISRLNDRVTILTVAIDDHPPAHV
jgi:hypothetical protein